VMDGRALAATLRAELRQRAAEFAQARGRPASLRLVIAGEDPTALVYAEQVLRSCHEIGLDCALLRFPASATQVTLRDAVARLGASVDVDGVVLVLPLPQHISQRAVTEVLSPVKDVDALGPGNAGRLMTGFPSFVPSTAASALALLDAAGIPLLGKDTVVVGRSNVGGKPTALMLLRENATVTLCHSKTVDLPSITRQAEVLFTSTGQPGSITAEMVRPGAVVLDAGLSAVGGHIVGDVDLAGVAAVAGYVTPVPGGLGPLTHLMLIRNTLAGPR
jgi:methylenetetrahydrofolate dehydrogenase (NADP+) / methenyltetrahydrofolate cyclohydrolase